MSLCIFVNNLEVGGSELKIVKVANFLVENGKLVSIIALNSGNDDYLVSKLDVKVRFKRLGRLSLLSFLVQNHFPNFFFLNGFPALFIPLVRLLNYRSKLIYLNNTTILPENVSAFRKLFLRVSARLSNRVVYGADAQRRLWESAYGFSGIESEVLYNGVDENDFVFDSEGDPNSIVMVGQVRPEKNYSEALKAVARLKSDGFDFRLSIVGGGVGLKSLKQMAEEIGVSDRVHFHGEVKDVRPVLAKASIFLLCSNAVETFSNAALEAMATGKVVVLSDVGGAREMVRDRVDGFIYQSGDLESLIDILRELSSIDLMSRYSVSARKRVESKFTSERMMKSYLEMLI